MVPTRDSRRRDERARVPGWEGWKVTGGEEKREGRVNLERGRVVDREFGSEGKGIVESDE